MTDTLNGASKLEKNVILAFCIITAIIPILSINLPRSYAFAPGATASIVFAVLYFCTQSKPLIAKKTAALIAIILGTSLLSLIWAKHPETSQDKIIKLIPLLLPQILLISLATSLNSNQIQRLIKLIPASYLAATGLIIFEIINHGFLHNIVRGEAISTITDPDDFNRGAVALSLYAIPAYTLLCIQLKHTRLPKIYAAIITFTPLIFAISLSESQSSLMSLFIGLLFLFCFPYAYKHAISILKYAIIGLTFTAPFFITPIYNNFAQDIQNISFMAHGYAGHRLEIWDYISRYALQHPFLGYGIDTTRAILDFDSKRIFDAGNEILHPHNYVIQIWIEFGLFGACILSALTYILFSNLKKNYTIAQQKLLLPTLMAVLFTASVAYGLWQGAWIGLIFHVAAITFMTNTIVKSDTKS